MIRWKTLLLLIIAIGIAAASGFWIGWESRPTSPSIASRADETSSAVPTVQTQPLTTGMISQTIEAYGTVQSSAGSAAVVSVPFDSQVRRVTVSPGDVVTSGKAVIELGPTADAELQFRQAQDTVNGAENNVREVSRRLTEQLATNAELATAQQALKSAQTQFDSLSRRGVQTARTISAGTAGAVAQVNVQVGQIVPAGTAMLVIHGAEANEAVLGVEPSAVQELEVGATAELNDIHADTDTPPIIGTVCRIAQQIDGQSRLMDVALKLPANASLPSGSFVVAHLTTQTARGFIVPRAAVLPDDEDHVVFTVDDANAKRHVVKIGLTDRTRMQIISDELHDGDAIVTAGNAELEEGMSVQVAAATTQATSPAETK